MSTDNSLGRHNEQPRKILHRVDPNRRPWLFKMACMAQLGMDAIEPSKTEKKQYCTMAYGRRFARTQAGYFALVPAQTQVGDSIAICQGGRTPLVLRALNPTCGTWTLLGDSYVHGIMNGEAFQEGRSTEIWIV
jgi:hypothetical protein